MFFCCCMIWYCTVQDTYVKPQKCTSESSAPCDVTPFSDPDEISTEFQLSSSAMSLGPQFLSSRKSYDVRYLQGQLESAFKNSRKVKL